MFVDRSLLVLFIMVVLMLVWMFGFSFKVVCWFVGVVSSRFFRFCVNILIVFFCVWFCRLFIRLSIIDMFSLMCYV